MFNIIFFDNNAVYVVMWKTVVQLDKHTLGMCHTYCFFTAKILRERTCVSRYTYTACLVKSVVVLKGRP